MKVLVTGGAGFIGGNFVHHMVNKYPDYQIVNLDLLTYAGNLETLKPVEDKPNYKFVKGDIADEAFIIISPRLFTFFSFSRSTFKRPSQSAISSIFPSLTSDGCM